MEAERTENRAPTGHAVAEACLELGHSDAPLAWG